MGKSVYSIVLDDDVINMIDILASRQGTSRSNLINRILAEQISLPTAETMLNDVYASMDQFLNDHSSLALQLLGNGSMINMRSSLQYKYNPSVKYSVEILNDPNYIGRLKVTMRSQNQQLLAIMHNFFRLWANLEMKYAKLENDEFLLENGKFTRLFRVAGVSKCNNYNDYGKNIAIYINLLDNALKEYFNYYNVSPQIAEHNVKQLYLQNVNDCIINL